MQLLRERGCPKVALQIRRSNRDVVGFYRELGYAEDDVVSMGKRLATDDGTRQVRSTDIFPGGEGDG